MCGQVNLGRTRTEGLRDSEAEMMAEIWLMGVTQNHPAWETRQLGQAEPQAFLAHVFSKGQPVSIAGTHHGGRSLLGF